jgi:hypothetical protein
MPSDRQTDAHHARVQSSHFTLLRGGRAFVSTSHVCHAGCIDVIRSKATTHQSLLRDMRDLAAALDRETMLRHCQRRISRLALTNCALLAWTFSDSVRGLAPKSIIDFALGRSTPFLSASRSLGTRTGVAASPTTTNDHCSAPSQTMTATVAQVPCLSDNYGYLLHDPVSGSTAAIDTPDAQALLSELNRRGWTLTHIWNTHQCVRS